jgi:hypothetical protein
MRALVSVSSPLIPVSMPMRRTRSPSCARAVNGHAAAPLRNVMNSRRFTAAPELRTRHGSNPLRYSEVPDVSQLMSALGQKQTCAAQLPMSAKGQ